MLLIGFLSMKRTKSSEDYFLGGRSLNGWVAALSAQASDMSGWLLMGLPGAIYALGTGQIWIAVGLCIGTILKLGPHLLTVAQIHHPRGKFSHLAGIFREPIP